MRATRLIAGTVIAASFFLIAPSAPEAQNLRTAQTPAEFPPASYRGKQYVDSRGCIFIRAGIDGNITWVPRVTRSRKIICGYKPTLGPGAATTAAAPRKAAPVQITLAPPTPAKPAKPAPAKPAAPAKPVAKAPAPRTAAAASAAPVLPGLSHRTGKKPSPTPKPTVFANPGKKPKPAAKPAPATVRATVPYKPSPAPAATAYGAQPPAKAPARTPAPTKRAGKCPNASAFSQQFINDGSQYPVRCGPQAEPPVTFKSRNSSHLQGAPAGPATRIVPRHVYENRQNTMIASVPKGYRLAWHDDRLNPHRAETTAAPDAPRAGGTAPSGFRMAWNDGRLNPNRGNRTAAGNAQSDQIWQRTVPRKLVHTPVARGQFVVVSRAAQFQAPRARRQSRARLSK